jgi:hypothetical protein
MLEVDKEETIQDVVLRLLAMVEEEWVQVKAVATALQMEMREL